MADEKKNKRAIVKVSDLNEDELDSRHEDLELTKESKPAAKRPSAKKEYVQEPVNIEDNYPDITEQIRRFAEAELPSCPHCGSENTASVQVGAVGRAITIAASTPKVKLVPNAKDKLGIYFCNNCKKYFN
jgi:hypothetical protein